ncbi:hypothetical protein [Caulobacter endophyticus]|uniref:hypothetical protein n=1 Tax=Caulobacter endophyticus TaxID=2172652 RepID=UPI00240FF0A3|nr:hypothetical protein [Caulobacter endophyticus]MDG2531866.1 hypothetical protein [Caulobacter endophyticus]
MNSTTRRSLIASAVALAALAGSAAPAAAQAIPPRISEAEVIAATEAWGKGLVSISVAYDENEANFEKAKAVASAFIDKAYGYDLGPVLFKPTLTREPQTFRKTKVGAMAYFVGHDKAYPYDDGFALLPWRSVSYKPVGIQINGAVASTMGRLELRDKDGNPTVVDKTWVFKKDDRGQLRIIVHHSSLPFVGY